MILYIFQLNASVGRKIKRIVDWRAYGFSCIETAYDKDHAEELLNGSPPDLIICDTAFPDGRCFDFLDKIHKEKTQIRFILTGEIRLEDVHDVLSLGVSEYIERPCIREEWDKPIQSFCKAASARKELERHAREGVFWSKNRTLIQDQFWKNLFLGRIGTNPETIARSAMEVEERIDKDQSYIMALITMKNQEEMWTRWGEHVCQSMLLNIGRSVSKDCGLSNRVIIIYSRIIALFKSDSDLHIADWFRMYTEKAQQEVGADLFCYLGEPVYCEAFPDLYYGLLAYSKNDVLRQTQFVKVTKYQLENQERIIIPPNWNDILYSFNPLDLSEEVRSFLVRQAKNGLLSERKIRVFQQDILQLLFLYMENKDLSAHELYDNSEIYKLYKVAILSIDGMCVWIESCIQYINDAVNGRNQESCGRTVSDMKNFIRTHLTEKISMEQLAEHVHLSSDYAGKLFKRGTNETIKSYLMRKRMEKARDLLRNSDKSISEICFDVGYDSPSYFIHIFRQYNGMTPKKYRDGGNTIFQPE